MATIEHVEKLREKANVTYEEAKAALDASSDDMLDAIIYLERQGKVKAPENSGSFTASPQNEEEAGEKNREDIKKNKNKGKDKDKGETFSSLMRRFFAWCGRMIAKGNAHRFEVRRNDEVIVSVPLTVLALLLILAFWVVVPLIIIGLFFGCRYFFRGPDLEKTGVNKVMGAAADAAEGLKKDIKEGED